MKKGIVFLTLLLLSGVSFAQRYTYNDPAYEQVARKIVALEQVRQFPDGFYFDAQDRGEADTYSDRTNLFYLAKETYEKNPNNFTAAYNYAAALLNEAKSDEFVSLPVNNAYEARKVLQAALKLNPKSIESLSLLNRAYEYIIFKEARQNDMMQGSVYFDRYNEASTEQYRAYASRSEERLKVLERRIDLKDKNLTPQDYHEAGLICEALGKHASADMYYEMERNAGCENQD